MKKAFYMMAAAAIALSSCSSEETTDVAKSSAITFRPTVGLNSRGVEMTSDDLNEMWVTGFYQKADEVYFSDLKFTKEKGSTTNTFIPSAPVFWQEGRTYKFVAISPAKSEWPTGLTIKREAVTCENFEPKTDILAQKDMIIKAVEANNDQWGKELELNFKHILSQIQIKVKNGNENLVYNIKAVRIKSVVGKKKLTYATTTNTSTWEDIAGVNSDAQYTLTFNNAYKLDGKNTTNLTLTSADATVENGGAMLIPQNVTAWDGAKVDDNAAYNGGTYISIYLNVKMASGNKFMYPAGAQGEQTYGWVAIPVPAINWEEGNKYIYTLDMSTGCGKVDPVDPGTNVNPGGKVDPNAPKDPEKGDNIFGKAIKFTVKVDKWTSKAQDKIDM